jgi:DNA repair protein RecO (recombination protein O)
VNTLKHEAIVLKVLPFKDSDLIVKLLTRTSGKLSAVARFARKSKRRFAGGIDIFDVGQFELRRQKEDLFFLEKISPSQPFIQLRQDFEKMVAGSYLLEACDLTLKEETGNEEILYTTLIKSLSAIDKAISTRVVLRISCAFTASLLEQCGIHENLELKNRPSSARELVSLMSRIEEFSERPLKTRQALIDLAKSLRGQDYQ